MSTKRGRMPEENARLVKIYEEHPELTPDQVFEQYASDEFKAMVAEEDDWEEL